MSNDAWYKSRRSFLCLAVVAVLFGTMPPASAGDTIGDSTVGKSVGKPTDTPAGKALNVSVFERLYAQQRWDELVRKIESYDLKQLRQPDLAMLLAKSLHRLGRIDEAIAVYEYVITLDLPAADHLGFLNAKRQRGTALLNIARLRLDQARSALSVFSDQGMPHQSVNSLASSAAELDQRLRQLSSDRADVLIEYVQGGPGPGMRK